MTIAYLVNQYPKVSHSFIRREIAGLQACGVQIVRFALRSCGSELVDEADKLELQKTRVVLAVGIAGLLVNLLLTALTRPVRFFKALWLMLQTSKLSERNILYHLTYLAEACVLLGWCSKLGIKHVHAHFGTNSTTVAMLCQTLGGPSYSFRLHGPEEFDRPLGLYLGEKIKRAAFVVAVSSFGKSQLLRWCDRSDWSKIHVVHCGADEIFLSQPHTPVPETPRLACIGRLSEQKGHLLLLEAADRLAAEGLPFKLVLASDGPLRGEIETLISQLSLQDHVEITAWARNSQVQQQILAARAMVLPSFAEGLPVVVMEALALGRRVISTYVAGIPELVEPGVCGWLVPAGSFEALTDVMRITLLSPVEKLEQMGHAGADLVRLQHDVVKQASKLAALFWSNMENSQGASNVPASILQANIYPNRSN